MKQRRKIDLEPLVEYSSSSDSDSQEFIPPPKHLHSPSSSASRHSSSDEEDDQLCMNQIEERIRKLEKQLEGQVKRSANLGIHRQESSHKARNQATSGCAQCKSLLAENKRLRQEISLLERGPSAKAAISKPKEAKEMQRIVKSGKMKLQKEMQLLEVIERLRKKLKNSIGRKKA